jgi:hypothetical protein
MLKAFKIWALHPLPVPKSKTQRTQWPQWPKSFMSWIWDFKHIWKNSINFAIYIYTYIYIGGFWLSFFYPKIIHVINLGTYVYPKKNPINFHKNLYKWGNWVIFFFKASHSCHEFESFCYKVGGNYIDFGKVLFRLELGSIWL